LRTNRGEISQLNPPKRARFRIDVISCPILVVDNDAMNRQRESIVGSEVIWIFLPKHGFLRNIGGTGNPASCFGEFGSAHYRDVTGTVEPLGRPIFLLGKPVKSPSEGRGCKADGAYDLGARVNDIE
jgi:hypothetical protein